LPTDDIWSPEPPRRRDRAPGRPDGRPPQAVRQQGPRPDGQFDPRSPHGRPPQGRPGQPQPHGPAPNGSQPPGHGPNGYPSPGPGGHPHPGGPM